MKKIYRNILLVGVMSLLISSCNDMDPVPTNNFTDATFWQSEDNSELVVNMAYNQMYSADEMWNDEALSDNIFEGRSNTSQRSIRNGTADPTTSLFPSEWAWAYQGIKTCNIYLENIDRVPNIDSSLKARRIAEIRFIRAWLYFRLTNFYGAVPFFTQDITLAQSKTITRTPKANIMAYIHKELDDIMQILPSKNDLAAGDNGRITRGAACAFQARAYLYEANWNKVVTYCDSLINYQDKFGNYSLFPSYAGLFTAANEYNSEVILDYEYIPSLKTWSKYYDAAPLSAGARLNAYAPTEELVESYITLNGLPITSDPSYDANNPYVNRDPRLAATVVFDGGKWINLKGDTTTIYIKPGTGNTSTEKMDNYVNSNSNSTPTGYYMKKYYDVTATSTFDSGLNIIMFRYADILMMYAEAKFELGQMSEDVWNNTIRAIRARAGFTESSALDYPSSMSTDDMRELIHNERRSELALEGLRYYDIIRWKEGTKYLNGYVHGAKFANNNTSYIVLDNRRFNENRDYLWSVPRSQMDLDPNLQPNNSGWGN